ncbi:hypothetical protein ACTJKN_26065 [Pedobacter sp. 22163]|uniref:hypothetical protein n=1 Tax=Pedobacter sp. 22163 TaxID=3453883 RepID=UPI003F865E30
MMLTFAIIYVSYHHNRGQFIFAQLLDSKLDFEIKDAVFGGIPIYNYVEMPRMLDNNGEPRLDVFVFRPIKPMQAGDFVKGQLVELILPDE